MPSLPRLLCDRRGNAILEFAIVGPLLLTLMLGTIDVGRMFYIRQSLEYATEEAARYYALNPSAASSDITSFLQGRMAGGMGGGISVGYADTANCNSNSAVTCTMISASYSFSFIVGYLGLGTRVLEAKAMAVRVAGG
jgi:Flp pilus assembly protein TadG